MIVLSVVVSCSFLTGLILLVLNKFAFGVVQPCGYKRKLGNVHHSSRIPYSVLRVTASHNLHSNSQPVSLLVYIFLFVCFFLTFFFPVRLTVDVLGGE